MSVKEEIDLIKETQQALAGLDLEKKKLYDDLIKKIQPDPRLESIMWDFVYNGVQCYIYDIESLIKKSKKPLDSGD